MVELAQDSAYRYGLTPNEFLSLTPHETFTWVKARAGHEYKILAWHAYHVAVFQRAKKPKEEYDNLIRSMDEKPKPQSQKDMIKTAELSLALFGGEDKRKGK